MSLAAADYVGFLIALGSLPRWDSIFPMPGRAAHFVNLAFSPCLPRGVGPLAVSFRKPRGGLPAALQNVGRCFIGRSSAGSSASIQTDIFVLVVLLIANIGGEDQILRHIAWPALRPSLDQTPLIHLL
ncbi:MAG: hypothetical protein ACR5K7_03520 [Symbiopectobacterium sp.]